MESALSIVGLTGLSLLAFAATNLDNLVLLVLVVSRPGQAPAHVVAGVLLASCVVLSIGLVAAFVADFVPRPWLGALGLFPIALGVRELYRLAMSASAEDAGTESDAPTLGVLAVAGVMLVNSADSLSALLPLFAETRKALLPVIVVVVLAASVLGCGLARWIASHERFAPPLQRFGPKLVPFVLIAVGLYVLTNTGTDTLLDAP